MPRTCGSTYWMGLATSGWSLYFRGENPCATHNLNCCIDTDIKFQCHVSDYLNYTCMHAHISIALVMA